VSVEVHSLGCRLNLAESERLRVMLAGAGDVVVVNSCAVTAEAVRQTRHAIRRARRARPDARLLVTGCAAEVERAQLARMPEIDGLIPNAAKLDPRAWNLPASAPSLRPRGYTRGFVQVQNGCDHACTFCVIPQGRGPSRSRSIEAVLEEVAVHLEGGTQEIVLSGVDLTSWGTDLPEAPRLGSLCEAILARFGTLPRLRLSSVDGAEVDPTLFELIAGEARMMPHLHLSLQSGDDMILKRMKRRHSRADAITLVEGLRGRRSDLAVGADLIAGFPTETDAMHKASRDIVAAIGIVHGHVFPYSPRPGTPAVRMPQVPPLTARARAAELRAEIAAVRSRWLQSLVGTELSVLAERGGTGHSAEFAPVRLNASPSAGTPAGTLVTMTPQRVAEGMLE
jgi:threonylcarbamoyladenosine tRNA methylthiotransferase MtaB